MAKYGILKSSTNTGQDNELLAVFAAPLSVKSNRPALINDTLSLKRKTSYSDVQRWEIETALMPFEDPSNFLVQNITTGYSQAFYIRMPQVYRVNKISQDFNLKVSSNINASSSIITLNGTGVTSLPIGEFIKFQNHSKVYIIKNITTLTSSSAQIEIFPKLVKNIVTNEIVYYGDKVSMTAMYGDDTHIGIEYIDGILAQVDNISLIEVL